MFGKNKNKSKAMTPEELAEMYADKRKTKELKEARKAKAKKQWKAFSIVVTLMTAGAFCTISYLKALDFAEATIEEITIINPAVEIERDYCTLKNVTCDEEIGPEEEPEAIEEAPEKVSGMPEGYEEYTRVTTTITGYTAREAETDSRPTEMANGNTVYVGAVACPRNIKFGTKVIIRDTVYTCEDRMALKNDGKYDIYTETVAQAYALTRHDEQGNVIPEEVIILKSI